MASRLLTPNIAHLRTPLLFAGLGVSAALFPPNVLQQYRLSLTGIRLDSSPAPVSPKDWSFSQYSHDAKNPVVKKGGLNPRSIRQMSLGSILGLVAGLGVSLFSKPLVLLIGLGIVGLQTAQSYLGVNLIPYQRMQKYVTSVDLRSAVQDNAALKISFGLMFAVSAFAQL